MKIFNDKFNKQTNTLTFKLKNIEHISLANSLRRIMEMEIPYLAFDNIHIEYNNSLLHNEFIKHRIELIPVHVDYKNIYEIVTEKYDLELSHKVKSKQTERITVSSKHFDFSKSQFKNIIPAYEGIYDYPITKLCLGQKIKLTTKLNIDIGKTHSKYSLTSCSMYTYDTEDEPNKDTEYNFTIESCCYFGPINPRQIFMLGKYVLQNKLNLLKADILNKEFICDNNDPNYKNIYTFYLKNSQKFRKENEIDKLVEISKNENFYEIKIWNEDYTISELLSGYLFLNKDVSYIASDKLHIDDKFVILIIDTLDPKKCVIKVIDKLLKILK